MARWASLIDNRRRQNPAILLDAGSFCDPDWSGDDPFETDFFFKGLKMMGYDAAGIGPDDIGFGTDRLRKKAGDADLKLLSSNIRERRSEKGPGDGFTVIRAGGRRTITGTKGGVRIGVFSVVLPVFIYQLDPLMQQRFEVIDPRIAALEAVSKLKEEGCDLIIALSYQGWNRSRALASEIEGLDIVINGRREYSGLKTEETGGVHVVDPGTPLLSLTEITVQWTGGIPRIAVKEMGGRVKTLEGRSDLVELERQYEDELKARGMKDTREGS
jgi:2',3'-cyclic-nucleotide 2'-phosphodiesterase (5'-nucleotidase family)